MWGCTNSTSQTQASYEGKYPETEEAVTTTEDTNSQPRPVSTGQFETASLDSSGCGATQEFNPGWIVRKKPVPPLPWKAASVHSVEEFTCLWAREHGENMTPEKLDRYLRYYLQKSIDGVGEAIVADIFDRSAPLLFQLDEVYFLLRRDSMVSYVQLDQEGHSRSASRSVAPRRVQSLQFSDTTSMSTYLWVELSQEDNMYRENDGDNKAYSSITQTWNGYVFKVGQNGSMWTLSHSIPVRVEKSVNKEDTVRTQIDISFPRPGIMDVTARTDSLTGKQRDWLGTHVIDSTAAGLR